MRSCLAKNPSPEVQLTIDYVTEVILMLDELNGDGYAKRNPNLVASLVKTTQMNRLEVCSKDEFLRIK